MHYEIVFLIALIGVVGGFANVFVGDAGFHLPRTEDGVWEPGFLGPVVTGAIAAVASWASLKSLELCGPNASTIAFATGDLSNALLIGFGGGKWLKSEAEKIVLRKTAAIAAAKDANKDAAVRIAAATPLQALQIAKDMS